MYSQTYPLDKVADGLIAIEQRKTWGKVIVRVRDPTTGAATKAKL